MDERCSDISSLRFLIRSCRQPDESPPLFPFQINEVLFFETNKIPDILLKIFSFASSAPLSGSGALYRDAPPMPCTRWKIPNEATPLTDSELKKLF